MSGSGPFGFDPEDFDRVAREAGEGLRDALDGLNKFIARPGQAGGWWNRLFIPLCLTIPAPLLRLARKRTMKLQR